MKYMCRELFDRPPAVLAGGYWLVGSALLVTADQLLAPLFSAVDRLDPIWLVGGWSFIGLSTVILYAIANVQRMRADQTRSDLETSNQQLQVVSRVFRHNVRNDLNVVKGYTELLEERIEDTTSRAYLRTIRETTDDIVDISEKLRVIEGASEAQAAACVDLVAVVESAVADIHGDDVQVTVDAPTVAWVKGGPSLEYPVREVFENAVSHNDKPVCRLEVTIDIDETSGTTCLSVTDNGPGIPDNERAVLQAESETPLSHASSIGLWLIKWLSELQGGTVEFDTEDGGTTVRLRFQSADRAPRQAVVTEDPAARDHRDTDVRASDIETVYHGHSRSQFRDERETD